MLQTVMQTEPQMLKQKPMKQATGPSAITAAPHEHSTTYHVGTEPLQFPKLKSQHQNDERLRFVSPKTCELRVIFMYFIHQNK